MASFSLFLLFLFCANYSFSLTISNKGKIPWWAKVMQAWHSMSRLVTFLLLQQDTITKSSLRRKVVTLTYCFREIETLWRGRYGNRPWKPSGRGRKLLITFLSACRKQREQQVPHCWPLNPQSQPPSDVLPPTWLHFLKVPQPSQTVPPNREMCVWAHEPRVDNSFSNHSTYECSSNSAFINPLWRPPHPTAPKEKEAIYEKQMSG